MDIRHFFSIWPPEERLGGSPRRSFNGAFAVPDVAIYDTGLAQASPLHRLAILVFMSYLKQEKSDVATFEYLSKFYRQALNFYNSSTTLEAIYAWYVVAVYSVIGGDSIGMAIAHCHQYCRVYVALSSGIHDEEELQYLDIIWQDMIQSLYFQHRDAIGLDELNYPNAVLHSIEKIHLLLQKASSLLPSQQSIERQRSPEATVWVCQNINALVVHMQYYLDNFLFQINHRASDPQDMKTLRLELRDICGRIMQLVTHLPGIYEYVCDGYGFSPSFALENATVGREFLHFPPVRPRSAKSSSTPPVERDTAVAFAYTFARLLRNMLDPAADSDEKVSVDVYLSAIALCRLCASLPDRTPDHDEYHIRVLLTHRTLFWAGLVLTKSRYFASRPLVFVADIL